MTLSTPHPLQRAIWMEKQAVALEKVAQLMEQINVASHWAFVRVEMRVRVQEHQIDVIQQQVNANVETQPRVMQKM